MRRPCAREEPFGFNYRNGMFHATKLKESAKSSTVTRMDALAGKGGMGLAGFGPLSGGQ